MKLNLTRIALAGLLSLATVGLAQAADNLPTYTKPKEAGVDYQIQGEYVGKLVINGNEVPFGAQVIALGNGEFDGVGYPGGLPGEGWSRGMETHKAQGKLKDGVVTMEGDHGKVTIADGMITVYTTDGDKIGTLKKTVRKSPTLGAKPPKGATVLFDGSNTDAFEKGQIVQDNLLLADTYTKEKLGDHSLHIEFMPPFKPEARGQARGNSGVYVQGRYEVQVLDSFGLDGADNECGGIYKVSKPIVNMCYPPLTWQTYDIDFTAAKYNEADEKTENARVTVKHNGVVIHDDLELPMHTPGREQEANKPASLYLQGHGNPVVYKNIWVIKK
ncbi:3-keto-disaccharide hydrolase [Blastopirellula retiformator]|uniref:3-keto-alpha-glucoside-1,2-lyase/3-keto-2-hydroxy-glucal hydratase domain-containing protein n=1 Tax=Blastopirellula retiformator TaxID=2527970 RepID=A0A5C5V2G1_9BACT|nr:DUF1080 domain-containing protein [Blastopirellula retiformator]TWT31987.1 hypothetical protein Enr8_39130 [Blastopirellula retiformator]